MKQEYVPAANYAIGVDMAGADTSRAETYAIAHRPSEYAGAVKMPMEESTDPKHISTSFVERQNLTLQMSIRGITSLSNAFSKKIATHALSVALLYMHDNFARIHKAFRDRPAMAAGITDKLWSVADIVAMIDSAGKSNRRTSPTSFCLSNPSKRSTCTGPRV